MLLEKFLIGFVPLVLVMDLLKQKELNYQLPESPKTPTALIARTWMNIASAGGRMRIARKRYSIIARRDCDMTERERKILVEWMERVNADLNLLYQEVSRFVNIVGILTDIEKRAEERNRLTAQLRESAGDPASSATMPGQDEGEG